MSTSLTLYDLGQRWADIETALVEAGGELSDAVALELHELGELEASKVDAYRHVVRRFEQFAADCHDDAQVLREKEEVARNAARRLKEWLRLYMESRGVTKLEGERFTASIQANGGQQPIEVLVPTDQLDTRYTRVTVSPDLDKLREVAEKDFDGHVVDATGKVVAMLRDRGSHLRFR